VSFLSPLFLAGAAAAVVPIMLHFLKRKPEPRVRFGAVRLLRRAPVERVRQRNVRELLLLALRVTALVLLAVAFARPFLSSGAAAGPGSATIVAIDTSYSMFAPGRFERAQRLAKNVVGRAAAADLVGVVTFSDEAEVVMAPSTDRGAALQAIDRVRAGSGGTSYQAGIAAAVQSLAGRRGVIVVVTDLQENGWDAEARVGVPDDTRVETADVGPLPPNFAVTAIKVDGTRAVVTVRNIAPTQMETRVSLAVDGRPSGDRTLSLGPNQSADATFESVTHGTVATATVVDAEGLQPDNVRYAAFDESRPAVLVVTADGGLNRDAFYVEQALAAASTSGPLYKVSGASAARLGALADWSLRRSAAIVLLSTSGLDKRGRDRLAAYARAGGGILLAAGPDVDGELVRGVFGDAAGLQVTKGDEQPLARALVASDVRHPIFQPFGADLATLALVRFRRVSKISGAGCQIVARFTTGEAALLDCPTGDGRGLILASDLDHRWNDFPVHPSFVPFVHEAIRYLAGQRAGSEDYSIATAPPGVPRVAGIATLATAAGVTTDAPVRVAVNVDPKEADPARISAEDFRSAITPLQNAGLSESGITARRREDRQHLWQYVLGMMVLVLALEGLVASRTV
jgi:von Willebrand factor type A domain/Aerotolerance regulator N-terminal